MNNFDEKRKYYITLSYDDDGVLKGANQECRRWMMVNDEMVIAGALCPAEPIELESLAEFMGEVGATAVLQVEGLTEQINGLQEQNQDLTSQLAAMTEAFNSSQEALSHMVEANGGAPEELVEVVSPQEEEVSHE